MLLACHVRAHMSLKCRHVMRVYTCHTIVHISYDCTHVIRVTCSSNSFSLMISRPVGGGAGRDDVDDDDDDDDDDKDACSITPFTSIIMVVQ